jgi:DNA topoisomerase-3
MSISKLYRREIMQKKIQAGLIEPTKLGIALVEAYEKMGIDLWKPFLRAAMEANMTQISRGSMAKETFLDGCLTEIQELFQLMKSKEAVIIEVMR